MQPLIATERLELIAGNAETVRAEMHDHGRLSALLDAEIPVEWPPDLNDQRIQQLSVKWFETHPEDHGWLCWYFISTEGSRILIGIGGFSDAPNAAGMVEVGYSVLPRFQRRGYATEALKGLVGWAFGHPQVRKVAAEIHPGYEVSAGVLLKAGFSREDEDPATGITRYCLVRDSRS